MFTLLGKRSIPSILKLRNSDDMTIHPRQWTSTVLPTSNQRALDPITSCYSDFLLYKLLRRAQDQTRKTAI